VCRFLGSVYLSLFDFYCNPHILLRTKVLMVVNVNISVLWVMMSCSFVDRYPCFRRNLLTVFMADV
jgi:hypothetical protein